MFGGVATRRAAAGATVIGAIGAFGVLGAVSGREEPYTGPCPGGTAPRDAAARAAETSRRPVVLKPGLCVELEGSEDRAAANALLLARRLGPARRPPRGAYRRALRTTRALARSNADLPGSAGTWQPYGRPPLWAGKPEYLTSIPFESGWSGRVSDLAWDSAHERVFAAFGSGGLWASDDRGENWREIGGGIPTAEIGAVAVSPAEGGTLLALTGDSFVFNGFGGLGLYRSTDDGRTWHRAQGVPDGTQGYALAVDPNRPSTVYAATGVGLFRSTDAGRTFVDVRLPTADCAGDGGREPSCAFANQVTDVVVQGDDDFGTRGGAVLAAVGWVYGRGVRFPNGRSHAPRNGLYRSDDGAPGSFEWIDPKLSGYALGEPNALPEDRFGRTELAVAQGPRQKSSYVYANIQDAHLFLWRGPRGLPYLQDPLLGIGVSAPSYFNGLYVSPDFGRTWRRMVGADELAAPTSGSAIAPYAAFGWAPGVQAWYNQAVDVDPTRATSDGVPTRITFGLEEVFQNVDTSLPQDGPSRFHAIGTYWESEPCLGVTRTVYCPDGSDNPKSTTTHPDQHAQLTVPDGLGGVTLFAGGDGGVFTQHVAADEEMTNAGWGDGANGGLHTLMPYAAAMGSDGRVYMGMQDNGFGRIDPDGATFNLHGADGFSVAVHPDDSDLAYGEYQYGNFYRTRDGGRTFDYPWPDLRSAGFWSPFAMDGTNPEHIVIAGRDVRQTTAASKVQPAWSDAKPQWKPVFDLGTSRSPGDAEATGTPNRANAVAVHGSAVYVGFCGVCNPAFGASFNRGIATNVGGSAPPAYETSDGWHIAEARGLPERPVNDLVIHPQDPRTVFVAVGGFAPLRPDAAGVEPDTTAGSVFRSDDAGQTFRSVSGDLPNLPALSILLRDDQIVVGTDRGVFISDGLEGTRWAPVGSGLPPAPVLTLRLKAKDPDTLVATTFGRGVQTYRFADPPPPLPPSLPACSAGAAQAAVSIAPVPGGLRLVPHSAQAEARVVAHSAGRTVRTHMLAVAAPLRAVRFVPLPRNALVSVRVRSSGDEHVAAFRTVGRRVRRVPAHVAARDCASSLALALSGPAFGGRSRQPLGVTATSSAEARLVVTAHGPGGSRIVLARRTARAGRPVRLRVAAQRLRSPGLWRIVVRDVRRGRPRATAAAWRL